MGAKVSQIEDNAIQPEQSATPAVGTMGKLLASPRLAALATLRLPMYRYLLLNSLFGQMAQQARLMAQAWLILALTNSDAWVGTVAGLPALLAAATALLGGCWLIVSTGVAYSSASACHSLALLCSPRC